MPAGSSRRFAVSGQLALNLLDPMQIPKSVAPRGRSAGVARGAADGRRLCAAPSLASRRTWNGSLCRCRGAGL